MVFTGAAPKKEENRVENALKIYETYKPTQKQSKYVRIKRCFDFMMAGVLFLALLPVTLLVAAVVRLDSPGPVLFRQKRMGRNGKTIIVYKFRTMDLSAPKYQPTSDLHDADKYITRVGRFLRKTSLDEIPQLVNIIRGDMSIVGPRPLILQENDVHEMRLQNGVYFLRPGLTGLAQINGRDLVSPAEKVQYDTEYLHSFSMKTDVIIFLNTIRKVFQRDGVVEGSEQVNLESLEQPVVQPSNEAVDGKLNRVQTSAPGISEILS